MKKLLIDFVKIIPSILLSLVFLGIIFVISVLTSPWSSTADEYFKFAFIPVLLTIPIINYLLWKEKRIFPSLGRFLVCFFLGTIFIFLVLFLLLEEIFWIPLFILSVWSIETFRRGKSIPSKRIQKAKQYKKLKINDQTWKEDFEKILREENWTEEQIPDVLQFAQNFQAFEKKKFEGVEKSGFDEGIDKFNSNWEQVFADRMSMGIFAVGMKPKTLRFLASLRRNCVKK